VTARLTAFARVCYDFVVVDDRTVAVGVVVALAATYGLAERHSRLMDRPSGNGGAPRGQRPQGESTSEVNRRRAYECDAFTAHHRLQAGTK